MGAAISARFTGLMDRLGLGKKESKILVLGLDNAGKTTFLYQLKLAEVVHTIPTIGFNVEKVEYRNVNFTAWDVGGQRKIRALWRHYYTGADGLVFVVDSADMSDERVADAREELHGMLREPELEKTKVLVMANKQDAPRAATAAKVAERLGLAEIRDHEWYVQGCCATTGDGIHEGLDWMVDALNRKK